MALSMLHHKQGSPSSFKEVVGDRTVSSACFLVYLYFVLDFFLRFSSRVPAYGMLRPTLLIAAVISVLLFVQRDKLKGRFDDPVFKAILVLFGYIVLTLPLVEWPGSVIKSNLEPFIKALVFLFFTALIIDTNKRLKLFIGVFLFCQLFRVVEPLYMNITQGYWGSETYLGGGQFADRLAGAPADVINPNELGFVIVTAIPFLHYLLWPLGWKSKVLYLILIPILFYALILTMSRGAFIALLVVVFLIFRESKHKLGLTLVGIAAIVVAFSVMSPIQKDRYLSLVSDDTAGSASVDGRLKGMIGEFKLGLTRPIVGHGLGTTQEAKFHKMGSTQASHNLYAELLIEIGFIGAIFFLRYLYFIYRRVQTNKNLFNDLHLDDRNFYSRLNKVLFAVFWMYAVYSINYWGLSQYYWYLFGGLVIAFGRLVTEHAGAIKSSGELEETGVRREVRYPLAYKLRKR